LAWTLNGSGRPEEAIIAVKKAFRLNPIPPSLYYVRFGFSHLLIGQNEKAIEAFKKAINLNSKDFGAHLWLSAAYIRVGYEKEARIHAAEVLKIDPEFSIGHYKKIMPLKNQDLKNELLHSLRLAGLE